ncbi:MAG: glycoside hydrolase, partial [Planctomycetaceae bacterium]
PEWIWEWQDDLPSITSFMCDYVETVVRRYHRQIRRWQLTASSNIAGLLQLNEDDQLWLTARLAETAWDVDSGLEITIGVAQPWGDYLAQEEHTCSPLIFVDNLIRAGLRLAAIDLEWIFGVMPRGTYCRDLLDASRLLDMYAMLGTPLDVTLGYPSAWTPDPLADPALSPGAGYWLSPLSPQSQAEWVRDFLKLAIGKPFVRGVTWAHWSDALPHQFPHCGLIDSSGEPKPALEAWRSIRAAHAK